MNCYFDSSIMVAAAVVQHVHHATATAIFDRFLASKNRGYISAHGLSEIYSVLTRTPFRPLIHPNEAMQIIDTLVLPRLSPVVLTAKEHEQVIRQCAAAGWAGGRVHDAVHLRCAQKVEADRIYTFNRKDFLAMAPQGFDSKIVSG